MTREEAKRYIIQHCNPDYPNGSTEWETTMNMAIKALEEQPITCKDCKHRYIDGENVRFNVCELNHNKVQNDDWFCADAERKEGKKQNMISVYDKIKELKTEIEELEELYCENCQECDCDVCWGEISEEGEAE